MPILQVAFQLSSKIARVQADGAAIPANFVSVGKFNHPDPVYPGSVVVFQGVRDLLNKRSEKNAAQPAMYPFNITNMQGVRIELDPNLVVHLPLEIRFLNKTFALQLQDPAFDHAKINAMVWPPNAKDQRLTYVSADPSIVTVGPNGELQGKKEGVTKVTVTALGSVGGALKKEIVVSVGSAGG